jgi:hypothetical protein
MLAPGFPRDGVGPPCDGARPGVAGLEITAFEEDASGAAAEGAGNATGTPGAGILGAFCAKDGAALMKLAINKDVPAALEGKPIRMSPRPPFKSHTKPKILAVYDCAPTRAGGSLWLSFTFVRALA